MTTSKQQLNPIAFAVWVLAASTGFVFGGLRGAAMGLAFSVFLSILASC